MSIGFFKELIAQYMRASIKPTNSFHKFPHFLDLQICEEICNEIDSQILKKVSQKYSNNTDDRIFYFKSEKHSTLLNTIGQAFCPKRYWLGFYMANRIIYKDNNLGSGEGWHRDSWSGQRKLIIYLNGVSQDNGPTQLVNKSHSLINKLQSIIKGQGDRVTDEYVNINFKSEIETLIANTGDAVFFNPSAIHRGKPLKSGKRYALTFYFFDEGFTQTSIDNKFSVAHKE